MNTQARYTVACWPLARSYWARSQLIIFVSRSQKSLRKSLRKSRTEISDIFCAIIWAIILSDYLSENALVWQGYKRYRIILTLWCRYTAGTSGQTTRTSASVFSAAAPTADRVPPTTWLKWSPTRGSTVTWYRRRGGFSAKTPEPVSKIYDGVFI